MPYEPFALRGPDNTPEWFCIVAGRQFGPWPDKGSATAGFQTELRRLAILKAMERMGNEG